MAETMTSIDIHSLEDFQQTLTARLGEVEVALRKIEALTGRNPALGTFADAVRYERHYATLQSDYRQRVQRLRAAIVATQRATATIIANYHGTEERNQASSDDIAAQLGGVATALDEDAGHV